jgi:hypothetical protein
MAKERWGAPGWPWELELLALVFVAIALAVPYYLLAAQTPEPTELSLLAKAEMAQRDPANTWQQMQGFFWGVVIVGLYLAHLGMAATSLDFMSTPFTHFSAPLVFSLIAYYRLFTLGRGAPLSTQIVTGAPVEVVCWILGVLVITFLVARLRMARLMLRYHGVDWEFSTPAVFDRTYFESIAHFHALVYPPRVFRACPEGFLVEGWFYAMPVPFSSVVSIDRVKAGSLASSGYSLATSLNSMVRITVAEMPQPMFISPKDVDGFVAYCVPQIGAARAARGHDTRHGTRAGDTHPGAAPR